MRRIIIWTSLFVVFGLYPVLASGQTTPFIHHGNLGFSVTGNYDFELKLYDTPATGTGTQQGATIQKLNINVTNGDFTLTLDFGAAVFTGGELFLETGWRVAGGGVFTVLSPREKITAVYANYSLSAANSTQLGGLPASAFIQNTTSPQTGNFNIAGNGTAGGTLSGGTVNATTQFNIGGSRILSNAGLYNLFAGIDAGKNNTTGYRNSFFGNQAGQANTEGRYNSFFGEEAGFSNTIGLQNAFFGNYAGFTNTSGRNNAFFGDAAGLTSNSGYNTFIGSGSGNQTTTGSGNAFLGADSGGHNTTGEINIFIGYVAGFNNTTGQGNTFIGFNAGAANTTGSDNIIIGQRANLSASNLSNAIAIGSRAMVGQSNALVLGSISGVNFASADTNVGIGTTTPDSRLHISGAGVVRARLNSDSNAGLALSLNNQPKWSVATVTGGQFQIFNDAIGQNAVLIDPVTNNLGIGTSPSFKLHVIDPSSTGLRVQTNSVGGTVASFGGNGAFQIDAPGIVGGRLVVKENGFTGIGTSNPQDRLEVAGIIRAQSLGSGGSTTLCRNASNQISTCSSSLRYKTNLAPFHGGLTVVNHLQPITFNWKTNGEADLGFGAEDVAKVEPLLVTHNDKGEIEGVKYDRISVVLLNAVKEQQAQISQQAEQIQRQQHEIDGLKRMVYRRPLSVVTRKAARRAALITQSRYSTRRAK